jgi:hypothetical protein
LESFGTTLGTTLRERESLCQSVRKVIAKVLRQQKRFATKLLLRLKWNSPARCAQCSGGGSISMDFELKWLELLHNVLLTSN